MSIGCASMLMEKERLCSSLGVELHRQSPSTAHNVTRQRAMVLSRVETD